MNYYESVVMDYLRSDRAVFVNTNCCIQLNQADNPGTSGPHWCCDVVVEAMMALNASSAMKPSIIAWDLETMPDLAGFVSSPRRASNPPRRPTA